MPTLIMVSRRIPDLAFAHACDLAASAARLTMDTWHVIDDGHGTIADDADMACWGYPTLATFEPELCFSAAELDGPLCITCGNDGDCPDCDALTTSIITTMVHDGLCDPPGDSPLGDDEGDTLPGYAAPVLRHSGLPNPLYRVQKAERERNESPMEEQDDGCNELIEALSNDESIDVLAERLA